MTALNEKKSFTEGSLFFKMIFFALPILATSVLQILYNSADNIVVGQFSGDPEALAAVGCTGALTNLFINLLIGVSSGAGVIVAQHYGAGRHRDVSRVTHTAMLTSIIGGVLFMLIALAVHRPALSLLVTEASLLDKAAAYVLVISFGIPATSVYNFGASILRSTGDSKTPLYILSLSGLLNVALNLLFVILFHLSIVGVALATIISQYASAAAVVIVMMRAKGECFSLDIKKLTIERGILLRMLALGIPAGLQSAAYNVANMVVVGGVNTFPRPVISANAVASSIDGLVYVCMNCFMQAGMTFTGQNWGAGKTKRVKKSLFYSLIQVSVVGLSVSTLCYILREPIVKLFIDGSDPLYGEVVAAAVRWVGFIIFLYVLCGISEVLSGFLRGLGYSALPMIVSLVGICLTRIIWVTLVFPNLPHELESLIVCFPISWALTSLLMLLLVVPAYRRVSRLGETVSHEAQVLSE
ncbi:MAG: MATE family efflux transporter [Clostridia bacterium]|nr:MATE family efflux transporter [Clostridia bacterium]